VLLNDPTFVEAARAFAGRILQVGGTTTSERLDFAFRQAACRTADARERQLLEALLGESRRYYGNHSEKAGQLVTIGLAPHADGLDKVELASWTIVARTILNLNEVITRN
jgi:hypothetical protein